MLLSARTLIGCITASVPSVILVRRCPRCRPQRRFSRIGDGNWSILENDEVRATYPKLCHSLFYSLESRN